MTRAQCFLSDKAVSPCRAWPPPSGQPPRLPPREPCPRKGLRGGKSLLQISRGLCLPPCPPECPQQSQEMQDSIHPGVPPRGSACLRAPPREQKVCPEPTVFRMAELPLAEADQTHFWNSVFGNPSDYSVIGEPASSQLPSWSSPRNIPGEGAAGSGCRFIPRLSLTALWG